MRRRKRSLLSITLAGISLSDYPTCLFLPLRECLVTRNRAVSCCGERVLKVHCMHMLTLSTHTKTEVKKRQEKVELVEGKKNSKQPGAHQENKV
ncbi:hypothetical protein F5H01DRAFT_337962, partial [Linnemannia elongata]